ncbi:MAG: tetratricopeptide repeat protein [Myxococcota bacterium]
MDRRARGLAFALVGTALGGAALAWGDDLRWALQHRPDVWKAEDAGDGLTPNAREDAEKWERIDKLFKGALLLMHAGEHARAITALNGVLALDPGLVDARVNLGFCHVAVEDWHAALVDFDLAVEMRPEQANAYYGLAVTLHELGDLEEAVGNMRTYVHLAGERDPFQAKAMALLLEWEEALRTEREIEAAELAAREAP